MKCNKELTRQAEATPLERQGQLLGGTWEFEFGRCSLHFLTSKGGLDCLYKLSFMPHTCFPWEPGTLVHVRKKGAHRTSPQVKPSVLSLYWACLGRFACMLLHFPCWRRRSSVPTGGQSASQDTSPMEKQTHHYLTLPDLFSKPPAVLNVPP